MQDVIQSPHMPTLVRDLKQRKTGAKQGIHISCGECGNSWDIRRLEKGAYIKYLRIIVNLFSNCATVSCNLILIRFYNNI